MNLNKISKKNMINALLIIIVVILILKFLKKEFFNIGGQVENGESTNSQKSLSTRNTTPI
tara:strand:+ start:384 stop:563 length:180 start_codon:yes stop_codon:yes gene_type:complete